MQLLHREEICQALRSKADNGLFIDPLLDDRQIGTASVDLRLGYDFLVSIMTRRPSVDLLPCDAGQRGIASYFQETRRDIGDKFVLYPNQVVLTTTLEYLCAPEDIWVDISTRSSFNRLGVHVSNSLQPGYVGCASLELFNQGQTPIELVVGARLVQARFYRLDQEHAYHHEHSGARKYVANVRPEVSRALQDNELSRLHEISKRHNNTGRDVT